MTTISIVFRETHCRSSAPPCIWNSKLGSLPVRKPPWCCELKLLSPAWFIWSNPSPLSRLTASDHSPISGAEHFCLPDVNRDALCVFPPFGVFSSPNYLDATRQFIYLLQYCPVGFPCGEFGGHRSISTRPSFAMTNMEIAARERRPLCSSLNGPPFHLFSVHCDAATFCRGVKAGFSFSSYEYARLPGRRPGCCPCHNMLSLDGVFSLARRHDQYIFARAGVNGASVTGTGF
ncbi:hypothetical protein C8F04DRAFT_1193092 [Mycena alexandri]|uniref:Uncharacterized protein n=1 Tax=Mycena alexandri TaxID=1745969 RepID=A0AAD6WSK9_9AGAR|nr:hypothetical protein C8F04DRAFT_1193092 [Mycena alexandri]